MTILRGPGEMGGEGCVDCCERIECLTRDAHKQGIDGVYVTFD